MNVTDVAILLLLVGLQYGAKYQPTNMNVSVFGLVYAQMPPLLYFWTQVVQTEAEQEYYGSPSKAGHIWTKLLLIYS